LTGVIYDGVNDIPLRATLRDSYGYCHDHGWMLPESGESAPLGIAIIHRDVLNTLKNRLEEESFDKARSRSLRSILSGALGQDYAAEDPAKVNHLPATEICPACERRLEAEHLAFLSLLEALGKNDEPMQTALESSDGLCIPHLRDALNAARNQQAFESLVAITSRQLSTQLDDLDQFIRKNDHRFRDEKITPEERQSWRRALQRASGKQRHQEAK
jgi:hypothetical protein